MNPHFAVRYGFFRPLLVAVGMGRTFAGVTLAPDRLVVRMGWGFRASIPPGRGWSASRSG